MRPKRIIEVGASIMGYSTKEILQSSKNPGARTQRLAAARQTIMFLLHDWTKLSLCEISAMMNRDRSTVHRAVHLGKTKKLWIEEGTIERIKRVLEQEDAWQEFDMETRCNAHLQRTQG